MGLWGEDHSQDTSSMIGPAPMLTTHPPSHHTPPHGSQNTHALILTSAITWTAPIDGLCIRAPLLDPAAQCIGLE